MFSVRGIGGGAQRQDVHLATKLLEAFLVADAESLFFVHYGQAKILELHVLLQQPVRTDDDIHLPRFEPFNDLLLLLVSAEPAEHFNSHRKRTEPAL